MRNDKVAPLTGARVCLADSKSDPIYASDPTTVSGGFRVSELPASVYSVAVEVDGGLFGIDEDDGPCSTPSTPW